MLLWKQTFANTDQRAGDHTPREDAPRTDGPQPPGGFLDLGYVHENTSLFTPPLNAQMRQRPPDAYTRLRGLSRARHRPPRAHLLGTLPRTHARRAPRARVRPDAVHPGPGRHRDGAHARALGLPRTGHVSDWEPRRRADAVDPADRDARTRVGVPLDSVLRVVV